MEADLTQRARLVPSQSLYLLHGLADLTAPYTHGVAFAKALTEAGIIFRYQVHMLLCITTFLNIFKIFHVDVTSGTAAYL